MTANGNGSPTSPPAAELPAVKSPAAVVVGDHKRNNLDFLRLAFALAVILSHSYPLSTGRTADEPLKLRSHDHATLGSLAVGFFFVVSGFLITGSYRASRSVGSYLLKRCLRIFPGYFACVLFCLAVVAPIGIVGVTARDLRRLAVQAVVLEPMEAGRVFAGNPMPGSLDGPLWTIRYEFGCYLLVVAMGLAGVFRRRWVALLLFPATAVLALAPRAFPVLGPRYFVFGQWGNWCWMTGEFLIGVNLFLWRDRVPINPWLAAVAAAGAVAQTWVQPAEVATLVLEVCAAYVVYCLAFAPWLPFHRFGRFGDFSYGTYLYGWAIQQVLVQWFGPRLSPLGLFAAAAPLAIGLAFLSWHGVERPFLRLKRAAVGPILPRPTADRMASMETRRPRAFTVIELLIVIAIIGVLLAILLPAVERARHKAYVTKCAANLRQIGIAISIYEADNRGEWPRTTYDPGTAATPVKGTGVDAADPFAAGTTVRPNDLTAGLFLLMKTERLPPVLFVCPYNDATSFAADSAALAGRSNFTDQKRNLAYSFANPYPTDAAAKAGYALTNRLSAAVPIGSDKNPGRGEGRDEVYGVTASSPRPAIEGANSPNHEQEGQNVLYADGHVAYESTPFVGVGRDNIFTAKAAAPPAVERSPSDPTDTILLPTDD